MTVTDEQLEAFQGLITRVSKQCSRPDGVVQADAGDLSVVADRMLDEIYQLRNTVEDERRARLRALEEGAVHWKANIFLKQELALLADAAAAADRMTTAEKRVANAKVLLTAAGFHLANHRVEYHHMHPMELEDRINAFLEDKETP